MSRCPCPTFHPSFNLPIRDLKRTKPLLLPKQRQGKTEGGTKFPALGCSLGCVLPFPCQIYNKLPHTLPIQVLTPSQHKGLDNSKP